MSPPPPPPLPLPLRHRLPNPPPVFVGRQRELDGLARRIRRAPVTLVSGLGGVGKTALVLATLHRRFRERVDNVAVVRFSRTQDPEGARVELARALAARLGWPVATLAGKEGPEFAAGLIDLAEHAGLWVVLDDLHEIDAKLAAPLLDALARYARSARFIVTTRAPLDTVPAPQVLHLGAMTERELQELARATAPKLARERRARAVAAAAGSPWTLLEALAGREPVGSHQLAQLEPDARALLERLALVELPLGDVALAALGGGPAALAPLERGGLLERTPAGLRLHDLARAWVGGADAASDAGAVGRALAGQGDPLQALEGARLLTLAGQSDDAVKALLACGPASLEAGEGHRLWAALDKLAPLGDGRLTALRVRCAVELGRTDAVLGEAAPPPADREAQLWWAQALFQAGRVPAADAVAERLLAETPAADAAAVDAAILRARCLGTLGQFAAARAVLDSVSPVDGEARARATAHHARWLLHHDPGAARRAAEALAQELPSLRPPVQREVAERVAGVFILLGRFRAAAEVLPELGDMLRPELFLSREVLLWRLAVATFSGNSRAARRLGGRISLAPDAAPSQRQYADLLALPLRIATGELDGLEVAIDQLAADAAACGHAQVQQFAAIYWLKLALVRGTAAVARDWLRDVPPAAGLEQLQLAVLHAQHARRWAGGASDPLPAPDGEVVSVQITHAVAAAEAAVLDGRGELAFETAQRACEIAAAHDQRLLGADAQVAACEAALVLGALPRLADAASGLGATAAELESPRFAVESRFFAALAAKDGVDGGALEACAAAAGVAPAAARRARVLLRGQPSREPLDALDAAVVAAARQAAPARLSTLRFDPGNETDGWKAGWGIDGCRRAVWLPDGRHVDLASAALGVRLLETLAENGGAASKETLTCAAWGEREYHPLRHDKRLQVAVLRLRRLIEIDPRRPARLVTTSDGYALGRDEPVRHISKTSSPPG